MRILYLIDSLTPGGAETSLAAMAPLLIAGGVDLEVGYFIERTGVHARLREAGARVTCIGNEGGRRGRVMRVRSLVNERRPHLVHTTLFEADVAGRLGARLARTPVVTSLVSVSYGSEHGDGQDLGWRLHAAHAVDAATAQLARRFHANSELVGQTMSRRLGIRRARIDVVHRGRDAVALGRRTVQRRTDTRKALGIGDVPMVLAVGRQEAQKGLDVLLRAVPALRASVPSARVLIAGRPGGHSPELQRIVSTLDISDVVTFLDHRDDVADLLAAADLLAFPSRREGLPGTLIEALALECPVVASDLPNIREVVGDRAVALVPVDDHQALAIALADALSGSGRIASLTAAGRQRFLDHFTIERSVAGMVAFYERALR